MVRAEPSWQLLLADLSLILFLTTAAALSAQNSPAKVQQGGVPVEPVAVFRSGKGAGDLAGWIRAYRPDPREGLTILVQYRPANVADAFSRAVGLAEQTQAEHQTARIVMEEGAKDEIIASFAFEGVKDAGTQIAETGR